jgi:hypothetical protein
MKKNTIYQETQNVNRFLGKTFHGFQNWYEVCFIHENENFVFVGNNLANGVDVPVKIEFDDFGTIRLSYDW